MTIPQRCHCGAIAEIGYPTEQGVRWLCTVHAPWQCVGCGPESGDEDNYPIVELEEFKSGEEK
jgi:hypothetical protein